MAFYTILLDLPYSCPFFFSGVAVLVKRVIFFISFLVAGCDSLFILEELLL
jgi:hypothetical protein